MACLLTSASVHDSQVAIPLMTLTGQRIDYLYDLMDAAYDAVQIADQVGRLAHAGHRLQRRSDTDRKAAREAESKRCVLINTPDPDDALYSFRTWPSASTPASKTSSAVDSCACAEPSKRAAT